MIYIRKTQNPAPYGTEIKNTESTSQTDTYSCAYINAHSGGSGAYIGTTEPTDNSNVWINPNDVGGYTGSEVVNSMSGDETHKAPSVAAVKDYVKEVYSTEETVIGTWIDGKPIYRKVITGTITSSSTSNETVLLVDNNIKEMVGMRGVINYGDNAGNRQQIGAYANANYYSLLQYNNSLHTVYFYGANNYVGKTATCIIEYTKTTD